MKDNSMSLIHDYDDGDDDTDVFIAASRRMTMSNNMDWQGNKLSTEEPKVTKLAKKRKKRKLSGDQGKLFDKGKDKDKDKDDGKYKGSSSGGSCSYGSSYGNSSYGGCSGHPTGYTAYGKSSYSSYNEKEGDLIFC